MSTRKCPALRSSDAVSIAASLRALVHRGHDDVDRRLVDRGRKHAPLLHDDEDPLEAEREAAGGHVAAEKHADQVVVAAAAADAARQILTLISMIAPV